MGGRLVPRRIPDTDLIGQELRFQPERERRHRGKKAIDPKGEPQFGLVAEEAAKVDPALMVTDERGKPFTVRYEVDAMLRNEFLKQHRQVTNLKSVFEEQQQQIEKLTVVLERQARQIQQVNSRLEANRPASLVQRRTELQLSVVSAANRDYR